MAGRRQRRTDRTKGRRYALDVRLHSACVGPGVSTPSLEAVLAAMRESPRSDSDPLAALDLVEAVADADPNAPAVESFAFGRGVLRCEPLSLGVGVA